MKPRLCNPPNYNVISEARPIVYSKSPQQPLGQSASASVHVYAHLCTKARRHVQTLPTRHLQETIGECDSSSDTNSTATPNAAQPPQLGLSPPLAPARTQQDVQSASFPARAPAALSWPATSMSAERGSAHSRGHYGTLVPAAAHRAPATSSRAESTHLQQMTVATEKGAREHRCPEHPSSSSSSSAVLPATATSEADDEDLGQSGVFDQSSASDRHADMRHASMQEVPRAAASWQALPSLAAEQQAVTAAAAAVAAGETAEKELPQYRAASDRVEAFGEGLTADSMQMPCLPAASDRAEVAQRPTASSTGNPPGRSDPEGKAKVMPRASRAHGTREAARSAVTSLNKPASSMIRLSKAHSGRATPHPSATYTGHAVSKLLHHARDAQTLPQRSRRTGQGGGSRSRALSSAAGPQAGQAGADRRLPQGTPGGLTARTSAAAPVAAAPAAGSSRRRAMRKSTGVSPTAMLDPSRAASAPAAASCSLDAVPYTFASMLSSITASPGAAGGTPTAAAASPGAAAASPRAAAASQRASAASSRSAPMSPRATAPAPGPSPTRQPVSRGKPPFVSTTRSGVPSSSTASPSSPRSPRPVSLPPKTTHTKACATEPLSVSTNVVVDHPPPGLLLDNPSKAVPPGHHTGPQAEQNGGSPGVVEGAIRGSSESGQVIDRGSSGGHDRIMEGSSQGHQGVMKVSSGEREEATPSKHAAIDTASRLSDERHQRSVKQKMHGRDVHHQPARPLSHPQLSLEASSSGLDAAPTHRQLKHGTLSQPPQNESVLQLTVRSQPSSDGELSLESGEDGASSISSMPDGFCGSSKAGLGKAGTSARNQFPQQADSVGNIAQLFMMRTRAKLALQVCTECIAATFAGCCCMTMLYGQRGLWTHVGSAVKDCLSI